MDAIALIKSRYTALPANDRRALILLSVFLLGCVLFYGVMSPLAQARLEAKQDYEMRLKELSFLQSNAQDASRINSQQGANAKSSGDRSLLSIVNSSSSKFGVTLKTIEPSGPDKIKITSEAVPFNSLVKWLDHLKKEQGVISSDVFIERAKDEGAANVRLTLSN